MMDRKGAERDGLRHTADSSPVVLDALSVLSQPYFRLFRSTHAVKILKALHLCIPHAHWQLAELAELALIALMALPITWWWLADGAKLAAGLLTPLLRCFKSHDRRRFSVSKYA